MTKIYKSLALIVSASAFAWAGLTMADEDMRGQNFQAKLRLRAEYDDNIYGNGVVKEESFKIDGDVELIYNMNFERSFVGFRYRPSFVYWADRPSDDFDLHHNLNVDVTHSFNTRATLALKESLLYAELPELIDNGATVQQKDTYLYNLINGDFGYQISRQTKASVAARHTLLRYDDNDVAENEDYDIYAGGVSLRHQLSMATTLAGDLRFESITYDGVDRDSESIYVGVGVDQMFGPDLIGNIRGGVQNKEFSADGLDSATEPYVDASITVLTPSHRTRLTAGVGYSLFEADVFPYASQDRLLFFVNAGHDLTARIALYASASYQESSYNGDQSVDTTVASEDGDEEIVQLSARGTYKINNSNWLEAGINYLDLSSDLREEFDRTRVSMGWRTTLQ